MSTSLMTVSQIAEFLNTSRCAVYKLIERKQIPHIRLGRKVLFYREKILGWLEEHEVDAE